MGTILGLQNITKRYPGVVALNNMPISFSEDEIHTIMGESGAGKSTMIKVVTGAIPAEEGRVVIGGQTFEKLTLLLSKKHGIGVIYQEFNLISSLSAAESMFLGDKTGNALMPDFNYMRKRVKEIMGEFSVGISPDRMVGELTTVQQQLVEIAKAICKNCKILIMDEPSASVAMVEIENMLRIVRRLRAKGITIIYISHRTDKVFDISDYVSAIRDGSYIGMRKIADISRKDLVCMMVGRELTEPYPPRSTSIGDKVLEVRDLTGSGDFYVNLEFHKGEILDLGGLVGAGRAELAKIPFGDVRVQSGEIIVHGKSVKFKDTSTAIKVGIGLVSEDWKKEGAFLGYPIEWSIPSTSLKRISKATVIDYKETQRLAEEHSACLRIKTPFLEQLIRNLSGENQQKVVVAKVLVAQIDVIIFDEPTRGIGVGAKQEIYQLTNELITQGISIIMISSDMEELLGMSDRIVVLHEGKISGELQRAEFSQERVLEPASGL